MQVKSVLEMNCHKYSRIRNGCGLRKQDPIRGCEVLRELAGMAGCYEDTRRFHRFLQGQVFHLRTGHSALTWLLEFKNLEAQRPLLDQRLQYYNFKSNHHQVWRHTNADTLSRTVIPKLGGAHRSGARKNYGNAPKLNYQLMKLSIYLLSLQNP
jgi:hypothetical protein